MPNEISELDDILNFLSSRKAVPFLNDAQILEFLSKENKLKIEHQYLLKILAKLVKDGYVDAEDRYHGPGEVMFAHTERIYWINWDGIYFLQTGGYEKDIQRKNEAVEISHEVQKTQLKLTVLTRWIAAATITAAIYYILEFIKDFKMVFQHI
jgi:hypothetical protein